jgi:hypothetical protein
MWLLKDGTVVGLTLVGHNFTSTAAEYFNEYFGLWAKELGYEQLVTTAASDSYFHSTGTTTVTAGPSTFSVTNYTLNSFPETITECNGQSTTLTTGNLSVGAPSGTNYPLITYINVAGTDEVINLYGTLSTSTYSFTSQVTSVTVA